jgi:hypothetical protein
MLFRFKNKKSFYLDEEQEVESRMRNTITFMLEDGTESRKCRDAKVLLERRD